MSRLDTKLDQLFTYAPVLSYKKDSKFILMSDCHRGQGNWGDNFLPNQNVFTEPWNITMIMDLPILSWETGMSFGRIVP